MTDDSSFGYYSTMGYMDDTGVRVITEARLMEIGIEKISLHPSWTIKVIGEEESHTAWVNFEDLLSSDREMREYWAKANKDFLDTIWGHDWSELDASLQASYPRRPTKIEELRAKIEKIRHEIPMKAVYFVGYSGRYRAILEDVLREIGSSGEDF